mgnify:FL=1
MFTKIQNGAVRLALALGCATVLLAACDNGRVSSTEEGLTTESEVLAKWGKPENIWEGPNGEKIYEYSRQPSGTKNYMITIGSDGKVAALRQVLTRENFNKVQPGMMMEDVRLLLGKSAKITPYHFKKETVYEWRFMEGNAPPGQLFMVTFDQDLRVLSTGIMDDPRDPSRPEAGR